MKLYGITIEKPEGCFSITVQQSKEMRGAMAHEWEVVVSGNTTTKDPGFLRDIALAIHEAAERLDKSLEE